MLVGSLATGETTAPLGKVGSPRPGEGLTAKTMKPETDKLLETVSIFSLPGNRTRPLGPNAALPYPPVPCLPSCDSCPYSQLPHLALSL